ncbi:hypothetical protein TRFO_25733 [Tritrichomonas foetus]|uniref:Uncharacterized protein n=1 Tax=Tritrichomonas foetus TaxID=1144522 RepID=A0A1J4K967_9EUKA|nr:hypothetical protein TRFO_25733 [Tritrichomonas foetus]|eukprot:OHT06252.1 hypothetical protein TRFO_25733 [Tritrichomonas foetus]
MKKFLERKYLEKLGKMNVAEILRVVGIAVVAIVIQFQIKYYLQSQKLFPEGVDQYFYEKKSFSNRNKINLPLDHRTVPDERIEWAEKFLKIPVWSRGYIKCGSPEAEIGCFELYRAAKVVEHWHKYSIKNKTNGLVFVNITNEPFPDRLSMLYHGFQIAAFSNRALYVDRNKFLPIILPDSIKHFEEILSFSDDFLKIPTDYQFASLEYEMRNPNLTFYGASYPQVLYTHHPIGSYLYENYGFHSAFYIGNFLFGTYNIPTNSSNINTINNQDNAFNNQIINENNIQSVRMNRKCVVETDFVVEGWKFNQELRFSHPSHFLKVLEQSGFNGDEVTIVTNSLDDNFTGFNDVQRINYAENGNDDYVCGLYSLISAKHTTFTLGSRLGFWASALLGGKSGFINSYVNIFANLTFSQQGSLFHMESPPDMREIYRTNTYFYSYNSNIKEGELYIKNLIW